MSKRAQARIMELFAERRECPKPRRSTLPEWLEDWYRDGTAYFLKCTGKNDPVARCALQLHRRLHALKSMSDEQFASRFALEWQKGDGPAPYRTWRGYEINVTRMALCDLETRLSGVVESLPVIDGYVADLDEFGLRGWHPDRLWYVNCRYAAYISLSQRLYLYKHARAMERNYEKRRREERAKQRRVRELEALLACR